jgi:peptidoglycan/LPS O-acetylase OafA/YrhL
MKQPHLHSIDTLRGLGALVVVLYHSGKMFAAPTLAAHGYLMVDFFFVLSGFVMTYSYEGRIKGGETFRDFAFSRFARLYPLYLFTLILGALSLAYVISEKHLWAQSGGAFWAAFGVNALTLPYFETTRLVGGGPVFPFALQAWAVFWEFVIAFAFYFWVKNGARFAVLLWLIFAGLLYFVAMPTMRIDLGWKGDGFIIGGLRAFVGLFGGYISAKTIKTWFDANDKARSIGLMSIAWLVIAATFYHGVWVKSDNPYFELAMIYFGFPLLVGTICHSKIWILNNQIINFFGKISYSLYLMHIFLLGLGLKYLKATGTEASLGIGLVWLGIVIFLSYLVHRFVEVPARTILTAKYNSRGS